MRVVCVSVGKGHDQQPGTLRVSFEDVLPPHATALVLTIPSADAGKFLVGSVYDIAEPTPAIESVVEAVADPLPPDDALPDAAVEPSEESLPVVVEPVAVPDEPVEVVPEDAPVRDGEGEV